MTFGLITILANCYYYLDQNKTVLYEVDIDTYFKNLFRQCEIIFMGWQQHNSKHSIYNSSIKFYRNYINDFKRAVNYVC